MGLTRILNRRTMPVRPKVREVWHKVYATATNIAPQHRRATCLAQFKMRIDADIWRDNVARSHPHWKVEVR